MFGSSLRSREELYAPQPVPGPGLTATVVGRGWSVDVLSVGPLGAELRWPGVVVAPWRGTLLHLAVAWPEGERVVGARVVGVSESTDGEVRLEVAWDAGGRSRDAADRRRIGRWPAEGLGISLRLRSRWDPTRELELPVVDLCGAGFGVRTTQVDGALVPGRLGRARLVLADRVVGPFAVSVGPGWADRGAIRFGLRLEEEGDAVAEALGAHLYRVVGESPEAIERAGFRVPDATQGLVFEVGAGQLRAHLRDTLVAELELHGDGGRLVLGGASLHPEWHRPDVLVALWHHVLYAGLARGARRLVVSRPSPLGPFDAPVDLELLDVLTGGGQRPDAWAHWTAGVWARVSGEHQPGWVRRARASLYRVIA